MPYSVLFAPVGSYDGELAPPKTTPPIGERVTTTVLIINGLIAIVYWRVPYPPFATLKNIRG